MCIDGDKSLEIKTPKSRHVVTVGKMLPLIHSGLTRTVYTYCHFSMFQLTLKLGDGFGHWYGSSHRRGRLEMGLMDGDAMTR